MTVQLENDSLLASWTYRIIETVSVSVNLSLHYSEPSKLINQTAGATNIQSYNFSLEGVRSCDNFKLCVGASNVVGHGDDSCIEGSLPYIPPVDMITYSLPRATTAITNFTLTVTVMVRQIEFTKKIMTWLKYYNCIFRCLQHVDQVFKIHFISLRSLEI